MLAEGRSLAFIANKLSYSKSAVYRECKLIIIDDSIPRNKKEIWVARIRSGRATKEEAMSALGVPSVLVGRWVKELII